jgi:putative transposase
VSTPVLVAYIDEHRERFGVAPICQVLTHAGTKIAPSTYYATKTRPASARAVTDAAVSEVIRSVHAANYGVYGVRKVHAELRRQGHRVARCTVHRLMRVAGLRGISRAKGPRTTIPGSGPDTRPDLVQRAFTAAAPGQLWVADITYCRTFSGWVYAAFVIDVFSPASGGTPTAGSSAGSCRSRCGPTWPSTPLRWGCGLAVATATAPAA